MGDFNYKKWLTENKYGKPNINYVDINEQDGVIGGVNEPTGSLYGCSFDSDGVNRF